jgi:hypothetical protein
VKVLAVDHGDLATRLRLTLRRGPKGRVSKGRVVHHTNDNPTFLRLNLILRGGRDAATSG